MHPKFLTNLYRIQNDRKSAISYRIWRRIVRYFFSFFGLVRTIHRGVQYIDFAEICHSKF